MQPQCRGSVCIKSIIYGQENCCLWFILKMKFPYAPCTQSQSASVYFKKFAACISACVTLLHFFLRKIFKSPSKTANIERTYPALSCIYDSVASFTIIYSRTNASLQLCTYFD